MAPKPLKKYSKVFPNPDGTEGNISFWPLSNRVAALTAGGNPKTKQNNTCFANVALHLVCFLAHSGPLKFVIDEWEDIKFHDDLPLPSAFVNLFEKLLINHGDEGPTIQEVHLGLRELSVYVKALAYNKRVEKIVNMKTTMVNVKVHVITEKPEDQQFEDAGEVFMWLVEVLHILAGTYKV